MTPRAVFTGQLLPVSAINEAKRRLSATPRSRSDTLKIDPAGHCLRHGTPPSTGQQTKPRPPRPHDNGPNREPTIHPPASESERRPGFFAPLGWDEESRRYDQHGTNQDPTSRARRRVNQQWRPPTDDTYGGHGRARTMHAANRQEQRGRFG